MVPVLFVLAGVVVLFGGCVEVGGTFVVLAAVPAAGLAPGLPFPEAGVAAGVEEGGNEVSGVGSGGNGLVRMLATISFMPASDFS